MKFSCLHKGSPYSVSPKDSVCLLHFLIFLLYGVGCKFTGGKAEVSDHKSVCSFKDESQLMAALMKEVC